MTAQETEKTVAELLTELADARTAVDQHIASRDQAEELAARAAAEARALREERDMWSRMYYDTNDSRLSAVAEAEELRGRLADPAAAAAGRKSDAEELLAAVRDLLA